MSKNVSIEPITETMLTRVKCVLGHFDQQEHQNLMNEIMSAKRIFMIGAGRSGLVGRFFCMRLMHIGKNAYVIGETITPSIKKNDLLIAISGSGNTRSIIHTATLAKENGALIFGISSNPESSIKKLSDGFIHLERRIDNQSRAYFAELQRVGLNIMPMGTLFELSSLVYLESVIGQIIIDYNIQENQMKKRHANLE